MKRISKNMQAKFTIFLSLLVFFFSVTTAFATAPADPLDSAYLAETMECEFTDELTALATTLGNDPVKIYNWIYENVEFENYDLSRKGAQSTYFTKRGNEWDQASLLITLLRIAEIPARYVDHGEKDHHRQVVVEAWLPTDNYRGRGSSDQKEWLPMVPWLKQVRVDEGIDLFPNGTIPDELDFDFSDYISTVKQETALEVFEEWVQNYVQDNYPGKSLKDVPLRKYILKNTSSVLPASLPIALTGIEAPDYYSDLPNSLRVQMALSFMNTETSNVILERDVYLPKIASKRFCLDFIPASTSDADIIASHGGIPLTPADAANVKPVFKLNGVIIQEGDDIKTGHQFYPAYEGGGVSPQYARPSKYVGTLMVISFDALSASTQRLEILKDELSTINTDVVLDDDTREEFLGRTGQMMVESLMLRSAEAVRRATDLLYGSTSWGTNLSPTFLYAFPAGMSMDDESKYLVHPAWKVDTYIVYPEIFKANDEQQSFFAAGSSPFVELWSNLFHYDLSYNEGRIFEDWQDTPGLSTVRGLMEANEQGITVVTLTSADFVNTYTSTLVTETIDFESPIPTTYSPLNIDWSQLVDPDVKYEGFHWYYFFTTLNDGDSPWSGIENGGIAGLWALSNAKTYRTYDSTICRETPFNFKSAQLTNLTLGPDGHDWAYQTITGYKNGEEVYTDTRYIINSPTQQTYNFNDINCLVIHSPYTSVILDNFTYSETITSGEDYQLPMLEDETTNPLPPEAIIAIKLELLAGQTVTTPVQTISNDGASGFVYLTRGPEGTGFILNMDNGGVAWWDTYEFDYFDYSESFYTDFTSNYLVDYSVFDTWDNFLDNNNLSTWTDYHYDTGPIDFYSNDESTFFNTVTSYIDFNTYSKPSLLGDPVNMVTGELYQDEQPDFAIAGRGFDLSLKRQYRSRLIYNGPFGFGWTFNHAERLIIMDEDNYIYYNNESKGTSIKPNGDGTYIYEAGTTFTFTANGDETYTITHKNGLQYHFDAMGNLVSKEDQSGNSLTLSYDADNRLMSISDDIAVSDDLVRSLTLTYNDDGKVSKVTDFSGRFCEYEYDGDDLVAFTDLEGNTTRYEYLKDQENPLNNHNMSKYILPNDDWLEIIYYKNDTVAYHRNKKGETFNFQYSRLNRYAEVWNEEGYYRKLFFNDTDDVVRILTEDKTIEHKSYDDNHNMLTHTDANGYTTTFTYDDNRNVSTKKNHLDEGWQYFYESPYVKHLPTTVIDPNGMVSKFTYWPNGKIKTSARAVGYDYDLSGRLVETTDAPGLVTNYDVYDPNGNLTQMTDSEGNEVHFSYDSSGLHLTSTTDQNGHVTEYQFYEADNPDNMPVGTLKSKTVITPEGQEDITTTIGYNQYNQQTKVIDALGNISRFEYDENRKPTRQIAPNGAVIENIYGVARDIVAGADVIEKVDALGNSEHYEYDEVGNIISKTDRNGNVYRYEYDGMKRLIAEMDPFQNMLYYSYDANGNLIEKTDKRGNIWLFNYDAANRLVDETDPLENTTYYSYDDNGNLLTKTDANNQVTKFEYDILGRLETKTIDYGTTDPRVFQYRYDSLDRLVKEIDPLLNYTVIKYDGLQNKTKESSYSHDGTLLRTIDYTYSDDSRNLLVKVVVDGGKNDSNTGTVYEYDALGRKIAEIDANGNRTEYVYDKVGNLLETEDPLGNITKNFYDLANQPTRTVNALDHETASSYDNNGNLVWLRDAEGHETTVYYDALNRKIAVEDAAGALTFFDYDENSNMVAHTDPNNGSTLFEYDAANRQTKLTRPLGQTATFQYDSLGRKEFAIDGKEQMIRYEYNALGQPLDVFYYTNFNDPLDEPAKTVAFTYDDNGNMESYSDGQTSGTYEYDDLNRKISTTVDYGPFAKTFTYDYQNQDNWQYTFTPPNNIPATYEYDAGQRLEKIAIPGRTLMAYENYEWQSPRIISRLGGTSTEYSYDDLRRIKTITANNSVTMTRQYEYSAIGNITFKHTEHGTYEYTYDELSQLTEALNPAALELANESYSFDHVGNRLTMAGISGDLSYTFNRNNELESHIPVAGGSFTMGEYDLNGSQTKRHDINGNLIQQYDYDLTNRITKAMDYSGATLADYAYDPFGRRLWKEIDGVRTYYLYSDDGLIAEYDEDGTQLKSYGYVPGSSFTTNPLYMEVDGVYYFYLNDHLGTPQKMIDDSGTEVWSAVYDSFGNAEVEVAPGMDDFENNLRFAGQYFDTETGLHYNWNRYYDPEMGRYLRTDPLGLSAGINLYAYVNNNPLGFVDPQGLTIRKIGSGLMNSVSSIWDDAGSSALNLPSSIANFYTPKTTAGQLFATSLYTAGQVATSVAMSPYTLANEISNWSIDSPLSTAPIIGSLGTSIGESWAEASIYPSTTSISRAVGNTAFGVAAALGGPQSIRLNRGSVAQNYYKNTGWSETRIANHMEGIDFSRSVGKTTISKGTQVIQYQMPGRPTGNYFAPVGTPANSLGINASGRVMQTFTASDDLTVLRSTASSIDDWSVSGSNAQLQGGGTQYFTPNPSLFKPNP